MIKTLLIANRGEIACRIMRSARALNVETVAVYSAADAAAPHVQLADRAVSIGPAPASESYLKIENIIEAARESGADAIHPGYGFLSENADFAQACEETGLVFVGPPASAIAVMGDKAQAKRAMIDAGVPCVPGYQGEDQSLETLLATGNDIGFPLMVKAAAGGGGRGLRLVKDAADLENAIDRARSEALSAFGSGELILEKAIPNARHVEIQIFGDQHGHFVHFGERDCSVQRRHQKVIEEAPCPVLDETLRVTMGATAVAAARAVSYVGAGTVEFLLAEDRSYYFLEMNTRLQVEHPVTEEVTGRDLVALQLKVAAGQPLNLTQEDITLTGHAIEVRLCAEDSASGFLPDTGPVRFWRPPQGAGIRVDAGIAEGVEVSPFYDSMIAKVIAHGADREEARRRLVAALGASALFGVATNRDFLIDALSRDAFCRGAATTDFVAQEYGEDGYPAALTPADQHKGAVLHFEVRKGAAEEQSLGVNPELAHWASSGTPGSVFCYAEDDGAPTRVCPQPDGGYRVTSGSTESELRLIRRDGSAAVFEDHGQRETVIFAPLDHRTLGVATATRQFQLTEAATGSTADAGDDGTIRAPMHGLVVELLVKENECVKAGDRVLVLEAMKMQHSIAAPVDGKVVGIRAAAGTQIGAGDTLLHIEAAGEAGD
ncbi:MAG: acetyl-CoA carboxylase biotin carboxylase subunit [Pseudomonadota bacterium]